MKIDEFVSELNSRGAKIMPIASVRSIELAQSSLQQMRAAMLPPEFIEFFKSVGGGIVLGDAYIFGPSEVQRSKNSYEIPNIVTLNRDLNSIAILRGKTFFGRNSLFWFCFDAFGNCQMLDNLSLTVLRKYDNCYRAILDCIAVGKI